MVNAFCEAAVDYSGCRAIAGPHLGDPHTAAIAGPQPRAIAGPDPRAH